MELSIENLSCRRAGRLVLRGLNFQLDGGRAAILRGPNGVGKSTLLRVLAGLLPVAGGTARFGGLSLAEDPAGFRESVVCVGHLDAVKPTLSVAENLEIWATLNGAPASRVGPALERFGLTRMAGNVSAECSAGQRRRIALARLLVLERPLWLLDEPANSLDQEGTELITDLVRDHTAGGGLAVIATHDSFDLDDPEVLDMPPQTNSHTVSRPTARIGGMVSDSATPPDLLSDPFLDDSPGGFRQ